MNAAQNEKRRQKAYRHANMVDMCFHTVDLRTSESMRDRASTVVVRSAVFIAHCLSVADRSSPLHTRCPCFQYLYESISREAISIISEVTE